MKKGSWAVDGIMKPPRGACANIFWGESVHSTAVVRSTQDFRNPLHVGFKISVDSVINRCMKNSESTSISVAGQIDAIAELGHTQFIDITFTEVPAPGKNRDYRVALVQVRMAPEFESAKSLRRKDMRERGIRWTSAHIFDGRNILKH